MRKKNVRKRLKAKLIISALVIIMISFTSLGIGSLFASAHGNAQESPVLYKYYTSLKIEKGDTLWDIAEEYAHPDKISVRNYVKEVKKMNHLSSDKIHAGEYLSIFYYDTEFK